MKTRQRKTETKEQNNIRQTEDNLCSAKRDI